MYLSDSRMLVPGDEKVVERSHAYQDRVGFVCDNRMMSVRSLQSEVKQTKSGSSVLERGSESALHVDKTRFMEVNTANEVSRLNNV